MAGGKEKEKIMLNMSDLQMVITAHETKTPQKMLIVDAVCVSTPTSASICINQ